MISQNVELLKLLIPAFGVIGTLVAAIVALRAYRRNEKWKRAEFLAHEMKEYFGDPRVKIAFTLVDWGSRWVQFPAGDTQQQLRAYVTRDVQIRALLPHVFKIGEASDAEQEDTSISSADSHFTSVEAAIRDCFDSLLDGLERFSNHLRSGLLSIHEIGTYLHYWIDDISAPTTNKEDAAWLAVLVIYIDFYKFVGVQYLFNAFNKPIDPKASIFMHSLSNMEDQELAKKLAKVGKVTIRSNAG
jgi:hypothetical protein